MALIKYSALVSDMRNKLNGSVASKNRAGQYLRNKTTPVNPRTGYQQNVRAGFGNLSSSWRGLAPGQIDAWNTAAQNFPYTNIFGDIKYLSGFGLFMKLNNNLFQVGLAPLTDPPTPGDFPPFTISTLMLNSASDFSFQVSPSTIPTGYIGIMFATSLVSPGKTFLNNAYRMLGQGIPTAGLITFTAEWRARFGTPIIGQKVGLRFALLNQDTGQVSVSQELQGIVS